MNTVNETGPHKGSHLFTPFESGQSGIQRTDLATGETETIFYSPAPGDYVRWDASFWTPWGTYLTAEEEWCDDPTGCKTNPYGRLFELTNPLTADSVTETGGEEADLQHRNVIPRVSHEGIQFDKNLNMYFIDELNGGSLYKYTSAASWGQIKSGRAGYFDAGQTSVLRVGDGNTPNATGAYTWVPITDANGDALPGALTVTDPNGVTSVDGRNTTDKPQFKGTDYQRPEDLQIQTVKGVERLYMATTTTNEVYALNLGAQEHLSVRQPRHHGSRHGSPVGAAWPARTTSRWTTRTTSTSSRIETAESTTTSGSHATSTTTATWPTRRGPRQVGLERNDSAQSSPACTSTPPTSVAPGSTSSTRPVETIEPSRSPPRSRTVSQVGNEAPRNSGAPCFLGGSRTRSIVPPRDESAASLNITFQMRGLGKGGLAPGKRPRDPRRPPNHLVEWHHPRTRTGEHSPRVVALVCAYVLSCVLVA